MLKTISYLLCFLFFLNTLAQDKTKDSLFRQLKQSNNFAENKSVQIAIVNHYISQGQLAEGRLFIDSLILNTKGKRLLAWQHLLKGNLCRSLNKPQEFKDALKKGITLAKESKSNRVLANLYINLAVYYGDNNNKKEFETYEKAILLLNELKDSKGLCILHLNFASGLTIANRYFEAEQHIQKAILLNKEVNDQFYEGYIELRLGALNAHIGNRMLADQNYKKALTKFNEINDEYYQFISLLNIAINFQFDDQLHKAKKQFKKAISFFENSNFYTDWEWKKTQSQYIRLLLKLSEDEEAKINYNKFKEKENIEVPKENMTDLVSMEAHMLSMLGQKNRALKIFHSLEEEKLLSGIRLGNYEEMEAIYTQKKDWKKAYYFKELHATLKDSLNGEKLRFKIAYTTKKLGVDKKEKENLQLKQIQTEQALAIEKKDKQKELMVFGLLAAVICLGIFGFFYAKSLKQKRNITNLQKELHHRIKNNLAIIDTFLEIAKEEFPDEKFNQKLVEIQHRIDSINEVHQQLYQSENITHIQMKPYVNTLVKTIEETYKTPNIHVENQINDHITIKADTSLSIGLIINEFLTNSFKYGFSPSEHGTIRISLNENKKNLVLSLSDNGKGLPTGFDLETTTSFGMRIIKLLAEQIKGSFSLMGTKGVQIEIMFPN